MRKLKENEYRCATYAEYQRAQMARMEIVRSNAGRRLAGKPTTTVPPKPLPPLWPVAYYIEDKGYCGVLNDPDELPEGCFIKWEPATR